MAITAELHDGTRLEFPDGTDPAVIQRTVKSVLAQPQAQASVQAGSALREIPRQVGLTARYGIEGAARAADVVTEPIRQLVVNPIARALGLPEAGQSTGQLGSAAADRLGLPSPQTADERVVGDATRTMTSAATMAGGARAAASGATGLGRKVLEQMAAKPAAQLVSGASAGGAGGAVREAGGNELEQFGAALLGGIAGGVATDRVVQGGAAAARAVRSALTPKAEQVRAADQQIQLVMERAGVDWSQVPERIRQGMREEVTQALNTGQPLNADALRRLLVFRSTGTTPTVGMLTQQPGQITREQNLAKIGANSTDQALQRLPSLQNDNAAQLLRRLDQAGAEAAPSSFEAGRRAINSLERVADGAGNEINRLYSAARDTQGRSLPLNGNQFTTRASQLLDEAMVGGSVPPGVNATLNRIARGEMPFTVEIAEQLKTQLGKIQRATSDGQTRYAMGLIRQALDDAPLADMRVNPGNLPAVRGTVPPSAAGAAEESIAAFNAARGANRAWMQRVEANPALRAVVDGIEPDQFVQRFVLGKGATAADVRGLRQELDPAAVESLRQYVVRHLRDAATSSTDDITKFSNAGYRRALRDIGDEKLAVFFSRDELQQLRDIGDAAKYMQAQPAGTAVNNSNSGALMAARGYELLDRIAGKLPVGRDAIRGVIQGQMQQQVLAPRNALVQIAQPTDAGRLRLNPLLAAAATAPAQAGEDNRRR